MLIVVGNSSGDCNGTKEEDEMVDGLAILGWVAELVVDGVGLTRNLDDCANQKEGWE